MRPAASQGAAVPTWNPMPAGRFNVPEKREGAVGREIVLWLIGVLLPVIILLWFFFGR